MVCSSSCGPEEEGEEAISGPRRRSNSTSDGDWQKAVLVRTGQQLLPSELVDEDLVLGREYLGSECLCS